MKWLADSIVVPSLYVYSPHITSRPVRLDTANENSHPDEISAVGKRQTRNRKPEHPGRREVIKGYPLVVAVDQGDGLLGGSMERETETNPKTSVI